MNCQVGRGAACGVGRGVSYGVTTLQITELLVVCRVIPECGLPGFSSVPIFLTGISLGGCVAIHVMQRHVSL